jgi:hypothetical protein
MFSISPGEVFLALIIYIIIYCPFSKSNFCIRGIYKDPQIVQNFKKMRKGVAIDLNSSRDRPVGHPWSRLTLFESINVVNNTRETLKMANGKVGKEIYDKF